MKKLIIAVAVLVFSVTLAQEKEKIAFGPYIQQMGTKNATICWSTLESQSTLTDKDGKVKTVNEYQQHSIVLGRLEPDTEYSYEILNDDTDEGKGTFKTYPNKIQPFKFAVLGDTRSRHDIHTKIVNMIIKQDPLFVVNTGDLIGNGKVIGDWEEFFKINKKLMKHTPYYPVLGNHEKDSPYYFDFFDLPNNERYYYFNVGDALFVVLDSEGEDISEPDYISEENSDKFWDEQFKEYFTTQKKWLERVLEINKEAGFIFVFEHAPLYSIKKSRVAETEKRRKFWGDIFERYNVQVFFNGHDHHYHHAFKNGVHYITTAGGGAGLYKIDAVQPETVKYSLIEHYVLVNINKDDAVLDAIDINGNEIEKIIVKRRNIK